MAVESNFGLIGSSRGVIAPRDEDATVELYPDTLQFEVEASPDTMQIEGALLADCAREQVDPFHVGATLRDRYRIEAVIGRGGCAIIYRARDLRCEDAAGDFAHVAIKVLRPELRSSGPAVDRLKRGFRGLRQFTHPNVVRVFDLDSHDGHWFEVMELLEGETLARFLHRRMGSRLTEAEALGILSACADALAAAHRHGVVHGDIKPGNFFLLRSGELRVLDFGGEMTAGDRGPILATPAYASPEVLSGMPPESRDDVFSFACVACELLTGRHPFGRIDARTALARGTQPALGGGLSGARVAALARGLAPRREDRPTGVHELIDELREPQSLLTAPAAVAGAMRPRRHGIPLGLAALPLFATVMSVAGFIFYEPPVPSAAAATPAGGLSMDQPALLASEPAGTLAELAAAAASVTTAVAAVAGPTAPVDPPAERQFLAFSTPRIAVSTAANLAALPVRRSGALAGSAKLSWRISERTALAGLHFSGPMSGVLPFTDGQRASTIFVPIVPGQAGAEELEFAVTIERVAGQARIGDIDRMTVHLR